MPRVSHVIAPGKQLAPGETPAGGTWTSLTHPLMVGGQPVNLSNPILLTDGTVIAHVSCAGNWYKLTPDNTGTDAASYINGTWTAIASLPSGYAPRFFGSGVLPDGRVIVEGGEYNGASNNTCPRADTTQGAIYDPVANTWTSVPPPAGWTKIGDGGGIVLPNGNYMQTACCVTTPTAAILNPTDLTWTSTGTGKLDSYEEESMALMQDDNVITVDSYWSLGSCGNAAETYNYQSGAWSAISSTNTQQSDCSGKKSYEIGPIVALPNSIVVSFPGLTTGTGNAAHTSPGGSGWTTGQQMPSINSVPYTMADAPAAVLPNGNILVAMSPGNWAAANSFPTPVHFWEYNATSFTFTQVADKADAASFNSYTQNFILLPTGQVMAFSTDGPTVQIYQAATGASEPSWQPKVTSLPAGACVDRGGLYSLNGTQFNGLTEGAYYGDDTNASTNFPLVKIVNNSTGHFFFARTFDHSTRSIAPNRAASTGLQIAANTELGDSTLYLITQGVASAGLGITVGCNGGATVTHDFNGDHKSDILWSNAGNMAIWFMNGGNLISAASLGSIPTVWTVVGQRDFDADGKSDILWRNTSTGDVAIWFMNGADIASAAGLGAIATGWSIVGTGDFNGDGKGDILWRNTSTGDVAIWFMNGSQVTGAAGLGAIATNWTISGTADFNGDGKSDILWRNGSTGDTAIWFMNGSQIGSAAALGAVTTNWTIVGTGDFDGDGKGDLLWRNGTTGDTAIWFMNGSQIAGAAALGVVDTAWSIAETGDFDSDGKSDVLWHSTAGDVAVWFMNGAQVGGGAYIANVPAPWTIQGTNVD
jgi:hypothetical protein